MKEKMTISLNSPLKGISKSYFYCKHLSPNILEPIAYIKKAKNINQKDFDRLIEYLKT